MSCGVRPAGWSFWLVVLIVAFGCAGTESGEPLGAAEPTPGAEAAVKPIAGAEAAAEPTAVAGADDSPPATAPGFASPGRGPVDSFSVFPAFMPPVAFGTEIQDCRLGTDPYSTCM